LSGSKERGSAFITTAHNGSTVTWIVTDYRPAEGRVSYARLAHDSNIGIVDVVCTESAGGGTDISVRYTLTAVTEAGQSFVVQFLSDLHYSTMIDEWRVATSRRWVCRLPRKGSAARNMLRHLHALRGSAPADSPTESCADC
jgi:hypothetical protein